MSRKDRVRREHSGTAEGSQAAATGAGVSGGGGRAGGEDGPAAGDDGTPGVHGFAISRQRAARSAEKRAARLARMRARHTDWQRAAAGGEEEEGMGQ